MINEGGRKDNHFIPCWEYFKCSQIRKMKCPAYFEGFDKPNFKECSSIIESNSTKLIGLNGPCEECKWNLKHGLLSAK